MTPYRCAITAKPLNGYIKVRYWPVIKALSMYNHIKEFQSLNISDKMLALSSMHMIDI